MNYYKRHLGDYARDTGHLSMLEHGAYSLILDRYYATERGIPNDEAYRVCRARSAAERKAVDTVLNEFFVMTDEVWVHGKCDEVIAEHREQADTNRRIAVEREATKRARTVVVSCNESLSEREPSHKPVAISQEKERGRARELPEDFKPPEFVNVRLRLAGHNGLWKPENVGAFVAHYRSQSAVKTDKEWGELFVKWMLREKAYAPAGSQEPAAPASRPPSCCLCPNPSAGKIGKGDYCAKHLTERQAA